MIALGLIEEFGQAGGRVGRRAMIYGLGREAGFVLGLDLGRTQISLIAETLDGRVISETNEDIPASSFSDGVAMTTIASGMVRKLRPSLTARHGPLRAVAIGVPVIVSDGHPQLSQDAWLAGLRTNFCFGLLPPVIENNVNCAAIAELRHGAARGRSTFAYLQVGVKIGLGLVHNGQLYRGANGAAGEVARIPYPWTRDTVAVRGALEESLGAAALLHLVQNNWPQGAGPAPATIRALFAAALEGGPARKFVDRHGTEIGRLAAAVVGIMDPGLIVMGGGVGHNPLLLARIKEVCETLTWPTEVVSSSLGTRGTVLGAVQLANKAALDALLASRVS